MYLKADGTLLDSHFSRGRIWDVDRIVVPTARVTEVLRSHHSSVLSGHWSKANARDLVERRYTFPGLLKAVTAFVEACDICQRTKSERGRHRGLLKTNELPFRRWQSVSMDWVSLPPCSGYDSVLIFTNRATKMVHLVKARSIDDAPIIARQRPRSATDVPSLGTDLRVSRHETLNDEWLLPSG